MHMEILWDHGLCPYKKLLKNNYFYEKVKLKTTEIFLLAIINRKFVLYYKI